MTDRHLTSYRDTYQQASDPKERRPMDRKQLCTVCGKGVTLPHEAWCERISETLVIIAREADSRKSSQRNVERAIETRTPVTFHA